MRRPSRRSVASAQAAYYIPTALAPFVSRRRFESVTGPKVDWWLVLTVGALVGVDGAVLAAAGARGTISPEIKLLGAAGAAGLAAIDTVFVARRRIAPTYLIDGCIQFALLAGWAVAREP